MIDPDVPNPNAGALRMTYLHLAVADKGGFCLFPQQTPQTVAIYQPPSPLSTEQHRYTFLIYRQPADFVPDLITPQTRLGFDVNAYASRLGLTLVGGNFFRQGLGDAVAPS